MKTSSHDFRYMQEALELAATGVYSTHPNPHVGCIIVKDNKIIGRGFHKQAGENHAEVDALMDALGFNIHTHIGDTSKTYGATAYVTLEPCSHTGRTPPCTDALIKAGIKKVVIASKDTSMAVADSGIDKLQKAGIQVIVGILEEQALELNRDFFFMVQHRLPYVRIKIGASLDGKTAMSNGESKWITNAQSRSMVQILRAKSGAIITSATTVITDDALLTVRKKDLHLPEPIQSYALSRKVTRVLLDNNLRVPREHIFFKDGNIIVATSKNIDASMHDKNKKIQYLQINTNNNGALDMHDLLKKLALLNINNIMVEAGATVVGSFIKERLANELHVFIAPKLLGNNAKNMIGTDFTSLSSTPQLNIVHQENLDGDIYVIATFRT